ncbi:hypothetical protein EmuJ_000981900 [Echinococcus multilocularis]|uniref:Uncharacterized protein n=1 Tax=Echinococcus multilocularis TaxID=6211 RepID=A0A068YBE9_ECHMU|nr:hypothetical protein EmuJ_000981900 [Echinococcus multilocularis]
MHSEFNGIGKFDEGTDNMSDWLTDEFTAGALVAIANATRNNDRAKEIAISIKDQMEAHFDGPWQIEMTPQVLASAAVVAFGKK